MTSTMRRTALALIAIAATALVAACGSDDGNGSVEQTTEDPAAWNGQTIGAAQDEAPFFANLLNSTTLALGENRLQFAFLYPDQTMVEHAEVSGRIYHLGESESPEAVEFVDEFALTERTLDYEQPHTHGAAWPADAGSTHTVGTLPPRADESRAVPHDGEHATIYTLVTDFDRLGWWGAELDVTVDGEVYEDMRVRFWIQERTVEPMLGEPAPPSRQLLLDDVDDISDIDTTMPPNPEFHDITVADALETGEPLVIAFVTPAFCQVRFCGPVMESVVVPAAEQYGDRLHFIHIEPYDVSKAREGTLELAEPTIEWQLQFEPIIFVVDSDGLISAKLDGIVELEELTAAIDEVLAG